MSIGQFAEKQTQEAENKETRHLNCRRAHDLSKDIWVLAEKLDLTSDTDRLTGQTSFFKLQEGPEITLKSSGRHNSPYAINVKTIEEQSEQYAWIDIKTSTDPRDPEKMIRYAEDAEITELDYIAADLELIGILESIKATLASQTLTEPISV